MRKRWVFTMMTVSLIALTGCSSVDAYLEERMFEKSGVPQDETYMEYQSQIEAGNADEEGYYVEGMQQVQNAGIHITFSTNNNLDIKYYKDKTCSNQLDVNNCYVNPGMSIYAEVTVDKDVYSSMYEFASFNIWEYDAEGNRTKCVLNVTTTENGHLVEIQIPSDFSGTELSVEPLGKYKVRQITLNDYYKDEADKECPLDGTWRIDDEVCTNDVVEMSAASSYTISYEYDSKEYFYSSSTPECYYNNNEDGIVIFNQREATDKTENYSVELRKYITVSLISGIEREVTVDGGSMQTLKETVKANTELKIPGLKYGDKVVIETDKPWGDLETNRELILTNTEPLSGSYKYTLIVPEKDDQFVFDPAEYSYEHGTVLFKCFGSTVTGKQCLAQGSKIYYEQGNAEEGYWLQTGENYIVVSSEEETRKQLEAIHFVERVRVSVSLKQPEYGGEINYFVDGKKIYKSEYETYSGTVITMNFEPWEGWMCSCKGGTEYVVGESGSQIVNAGGTDVSKLFTEDENHKPKLNVVLEKSVGEDIRFDFTASGLDTQTYAYESVWYRNDYKIIDGRKIGTESPIVISMQNKAIPSGKAVKVVVTKTDSNKKTETSEIRYVDDLTELQEPIYIYKDTEIANSTKWYSSINIVVSIVDVTSFTEPSAGKNTVITVQNADTMKELKQGDLIEKSQNIIVKIAPTTGYYIVDGNNTGKTEYTDTMKYSKYMKDIEEMIEKHYAEKICSVKLDVSDSFAEYSYKYDGEQVSGTVKIRAGEELTLEYEITESNYKLSEGAGGVFGIGESYKKVTKTIIVTADMDGKTITKADFGIKVEEGE